MRRCRIATFHLMLAFATLSFVSVAVPSGQEKPVASKFKLPPGFIIEKVAGPPLVGHPMMGGFDEQGNLYLAESAGENLKKDDLLKVFPNFIRRLDPADAKGVFHKGRIWADKMTFPMGALWHDGSLYAGSPPSMWKLTDAVGKGVADVRTEIVTKFGFTGNAADIHGPFLSPDGRLYWCDGRHGHEIPRPDGTILKGKAARIFRCKPDGSDVEVVCGGGMDNPVEIAFTDEAEPFVTVDILHNLPSRNDGIVFAIEGGVYPWHEVYKEFPRTGDLLPAVADLGWVAPSGITRYRSGAFGKEYEGNLFTAQFNRHRIQRHFVTRDGATFKVKTEDFLVTDDNDFHPTDVLEDADGSLLVIETGGWFRIGCPTSQLAKPEIKGGIYRVRKVGEGVVADPRGLKLDWVNATPADLVKLLDDPRFTVRDRAIMALAKRGKEAIAALDKAIDSPSPRLRRNVVWALNRIEHPEARAAVRSILQERELSVLLAAIHSAGLHRDAMSLSRMITLMDHENPAIKRQAATAIGRIKQRRGVPALMDAMRVGGDRFLEHALIYALIQINEPEAVSGFLIDVSPRVRRAALVALDQMPAGKLAREQVTPLLTTDDPALLKAALEIIATRPTWGADIVHLLKGWLAEKTIERTRRDTLRSLLIALSKEPSIQDLMGATLGHEQTSTAARLILLEAMARSPVAKLPPDWYKGIDLSLEHPDPAVVRQAIAGIRERNLTTFDAALEALVQASQRPDDVRVAAFAAAAPRLKGVPDDVFAFLIEQLHPEKSPLSRLAVAGGLGKSTLSAAQLQSLAKVVAAAGPLEMPHLLGAFENATDPALGSRLIASLTKAPGSGSLTPHAVEKAVAKFPAEVQAEAKTLLERLQVGSAEQKTRIAALEGAMSGGNVALGRDLFFGPKATCAACHAINGKGGTIGPELGKIGAIRPARDLLESLVFPSASFVRGFEPYVVETRAGQIHTGILTRETAEAIFLVTTERHEIRVPRAEVESLQPGRVSIMPQGMDAVLTREELRHVMAFLQSLR